MTERHDYQIESAWFELDGLPYPVQGYYDKRDYWNGFACPAFTRDQAELIVDLINRDLPTPAYEWEGDAIKAVWSEEGYYLRNRSVANLDLWWLGARAWCWMVAEPPDDTMWHLEFQAREESGVLVYGSGHTLVQALAELEKKLITLCGVEAAFHEHCCFLNRDIVNITSELEAVGGVFSCFDFSDPDGAFEIRRIPINPEVQVTGVAPEQLLAEAVKNLEDLQALFPIIKRA